MTLRARGQKNTYQKKVYIGQLFNQNRITMPNDFKPNVGKRVSKKEAMKWIEKYDQEMRKDKATDTKSIFYGRDVLLRILSKEGSAGITFFLAMKYNEYAKKDTVQLVLVPTREDGSLIWPKEESETQAKALTAAAVESTASLEGTEGGAYDNSITCPPYCPNQS